MLEIFLEGVKIFAYHGVNPDEKINGQDFYIDALLHVDIDPHNINDDVLNTVSYADINKLIIKVSTDNTFNLIESLAVTIADKILSEFPLVASACITINKPNAPIKGNFKNVGVRYNAKR